MNLDRKRIAAVETLEAMGYVFADGAWKPDDDGGLRSAPALLLEDLGYGYFRGFWHLPWIAPLGRLIEAGDVMFRLLETGEPQEYPDAEQDNRAQRRALRVWSAKRRLFHEPILTPRRHYWRAHLFEDDTAP